MVGATLTVDGSPFPVTCTWIHQQTSAYPGGHQFELRVAIGLVKNVLVQMGLDPQKTQAITSDQSWTLLDFLVTHYSKLKTEAPETKLAVPRKPIYVLNTISKLTPKDGAVSIWGECSEYVPNAFPPS